MRDKIIGSQVAKGKSEIKNSNNSYTINKMRKETIIISFIVGVISSLIGSYIFNTYLM
jgi:lysozyme family protein